MKTTITSISCIFIAAGFFCLLLNTFSYSKSHLAPQTELSETVRTIIYPLSVKNLTSEVILHPQIAVAGPHICNLGQTVTRTEASLPYTEEIDDIFNNNFIFSFTAIPPYGTKQIAVAAEVRFSQAQCKNEPIIPQQYLEGDGASSTKPTALTGLALQLNNKSTLKTAENINAWIAGNLEKTTYSSAERGALWAFEKRKGDCTEFAQLFVSLSRLAGIPARRISGYKIERDTYLDSSDFHDWAQFYLDNRWHVADPYYNTFMKNEDHYVAIRVHAPTSQNGFFYRWKSSDERLKISMMRH